MKPDFKQEKKNCNNTKNVNWQDLPYQKKTDDTGGKSAIYLLRKVNTGATLNINNQVFLDFLNNDCDFR